MGVDIHMFLVNRKGVYLRTNLYEGRNSKWFDLLQGNHNYGNEYQFLYEKTSFGIPEFVKGDILEDYNQEPGSGYYGFHYISAYDYAKWFDTYNPEVDAGWVSTYDKWRYENKNIVPELQYKLYNDDNPNDMIFIEIANPYDPNIKVINTIQEALADKPFAEWKDYYIVYYFDC